jgi:hypothetical protein
LPSTKCFFHWSLESLSRSLAHPAIVLLVRTCFGKIQHFVRQYDVSQIQSSAPE